MYGLSNGIIANDLEWVWMSLLLFETFVWTECSVIGHICSELGRVLWGDPVCHGCDCSQRTQFIWNEVTWDKSRQYEMRWVVWTLLYPASPLSSWQVENFVVAIFSSLLTFLANAESVLPTASCFISNINYYDVMSAVYLSHIFLDFGPVTSIFAP